MRENKICALNFRIYLGKNNICRITTKVGSLLLVSTPVPPTQFVNLFYFFYLLYEKSVTFLSLLFIFLILI